MSFCNQRKQIISICPAGASGLAGEAVSLPWLHSVPSSRVLGNQPEGAIITNNFCSGPGPELEPYILSLHLRLHLSLCLKHFLSVAGLFLVVSSSLTSPHTTTAPPLSLMVSYSLGLTSIHLLSISPPPPAPRMPASRGQARYLDHC